MKVNGTNLAMTRGDTDSIVVSCPDRLFTEGDELIFTVKKSALTANILIQKKVTQFDEGKAVFEILPADTQKMYSGAYKYDIQLTTADGTVTTIIKPSLFTLEGEVTWNE